MAELKGVAVSIPNEAILINTLTLQEAKDSSEIENIVTTHDELYKAKLFEGALTNPAAKEVQDYALAQKEGFHVVRRQKIIRLSDILAVQQHLEKNAYTSESCHPFQPKAATRTRAKLPPIRSVATLE